MVCVSLQNSIILSPLVPPISEVKLTSGTSGGTSTMVSTQQIEFRDSGGIGGNYSPNELYDYTFENTSGTGFEISVGAFSFEEYTYNQYDRLGIVVSNDGVNFSNVSVSWLQTSSTTTCPWSSSFGGSAWNSTASRNGYIFPSNNARAISSPLNWNGSNIVITEKYLKFCFTSDNSAQFPGWDLTVICS